MIRKEEVKEMYMTHAKESMEAVELIKTYLPESDRRIQDSILSIAIKEEFIEASAEYHLLLEEAFNSRLSIRQAELINMELGNVSLDEEYTKDLNKENQENEDYEEYTNALMERTTQNKLTKLNAKNVTELRNKLTKIQYEITQSLMELIKL